MERDAGAPGATTVEDAPTVTPTAAPTSNEVTAVVDASAEAESLPQVDAGEEPAFVPPTAPNGVSEIEDGEPDSSVPKGVHGAIVFVEEVNIQQARFRYRDLKQSDSVLLHDPELSIGEWQCSTDGKVCIFGAFDPVVREGQVMFLVRFENGVAPKVTPLLNAPAFDYDGLFTADVYNVPILATDGSAVFAELVSQGVSRFAVIHLDAAEPRLEFLELDPELTPLLPFNGATPSLDRLLFYTRTPDGLSSLHLVDRRVGPPEIWDLGLMPHEVYDAELTDNGQHVLYRWVDDTMGLEYFDVSKPNGTHQTLDGFDYALSPDQSKIAFIREESVLLAQLDAVGGPMPVAPFPPETRRDDTSSYAPNMSFSPNGQHFAMRGGQPAAAGRLPGTLWWAPFPDTGPEPGVAVDTREEVGFNDVRQFWFTFDSLGMLYRTGLDQDYVVSIANDESSVPEPAFAPLPERAHRDYLIDVKGRYAMTSYVTEPEGDKPSSEVVQLARLENGYVAGRFAGLVAGHSDATPTWHPDVVTVLAFDGLESDALMKVYRLELGADAPTKILVAEHAGGASGVAWRLSRDRSATFYSVANSTNSSEVGAHVAFIDGSHVQIGDASVKGVAHILF